MPRNQDTAAMLRCRGAGSGLLLCLLFAAGFAGAAERNDALEAVGAELLTRLGAEPSSCPDLPHGFGPFHAAVCGRVERDLADGDRIRAIVDETLATRPPSVRPKPYEWKHQGRQHWRNSIVGTDQVTFGFHEKSGKMAFFYPLLPPPCLAAELRVPRPLPEGYRIPVRVDGPHPQPDFPEAARAARTGGMVVLEAVIDAEGRIEEICVQESSRKSYGFEDAAIAAVRQWRYHPATRDGIPIPFSMNVWVKFEIR